MFSPSHLQRKLHLLRKSLGTANCLLAHGGVTALVAAIAVISAVVLVSWPLESNCQTVGGGNGVIGHEVGDRCSVVFFAPWSR